MDSTPIVFSVFGKRKIGSESYGSVQAGYNLIVIIICKIFFQEVQEEELAKKRKKGEGNTGNEYSHPGGIRSLGREILSFHCNA
jgi:hypothetical protein